MDEDLVVWNDSYSVGFTPMDDQHKKLVDIINSLLWSCRGGNSVSKTDSMLSFSKASEYALTHFRAEEEYMKKAAFPDIDSHKKEHEKFLAEVKSAFKKYQESDSAPIDLAIYLKKWLLNHIAVIDKKYTPYLAKLQQ